MTPKERDAARREIARRSPTCWCIAHNYLTGQHNSVEALSTMKESTLASVEDETVHERRLVSRWVEVDHGSE
jgi:hypothetical protein